MSTSKLRPPGTLSIGLSRIGIELKQLFLTGRRSSSRSHCR